MEMLELFEYCNKKMKSVLLFCLVILLIPFGCAKKIESPIDPNLTVYEKTPYLPSIQWVFSKINLPIRHNNMLVLGKDNLFLSTQDGTFSAIDKTKGSLLWDYKSEGFTMRFSGKFNYINATTAVSDKVVYFACSDAYLYALDSASGKLLWKYLTASSSMLTCVPLIDQNTLYYASDNGVIHAIDISNGSKLWSLDLKNHIHTQDFPFLIDGLGLDEGNLYLNNESFDSLIALDTATGQKVRFHNETPSEQEDRHIWGHPLIHNKTAFYSFSRAINPNTPQNASIEKKKVETTLLALNLANQKKLWEFTATGTSSHGPMLSGNLVLISTYDILSSSTKEIKAKLFAADPQNGKKQWEHTFDEIIFNLSANNDHVFFNTEDSLYCLEAKSGKTLWKYYALGEITSIAVDQSLVCFSTEDQIYAIKLFK